jgi:hypothetical protein
MLPVSLDCPFVIAPSVLFNVYLTETCEHVYLFIGFIYNTILWKSYFCLWILPFHFSLINDVLVQNERRIVDRKCRFRAPTTNGTWYIFLFNQGVIERWKNSKSFPQIQWENRRYRQNTLIHKYMATHSLGFIHALQYQKW